MAAFDFPNNPAVGDRTTNIGGIVYIWDGQKWVNGTTPSSSVQTNCVVFTGAGLNPMYECLDSNSNIQISDMNKAGKVWITQQGSISNQNAGGNLLLLAGSNGDYGEVTVNTGYLTINSTPEDLSGWLYFKHLGQYRWSISKTNDTDSASAGSNFAIRRHGSDFYPRNGAVIYIPRDTAFVRVGPSLQGSGAETVPAYQLDVAGDVNISAGSVYRINGVPLSFGGSQTPWLSDIDGAGHLLSYVGGIGVGVNQAAAPGIPVQILCRSVFNDAVAATDNDPTSWMGFSLRVDLVNGNSSSFRYYGPNHMWGVQYRGCTVIEANYVAGGAGDIWFRLGGTEKVRFTRLGNVGINKTSPGYNLDVGGDCNITGTYRINGTPIPGQTPWVQNIDGAGFILNNAYVLNATSSVNTPAVTSSAILDLTSTAYTRLRVGGTDAMLVAQNTTTVYCAVQLLSQNSGLNPTLRFTNDGSNSWYLMQDTSLAGPNAMRITYAASGAGSPSAIMTLMPSGSVGIANNASPPYAATTYPYLVVGPQTVGTTYGIILVCANTSTVNAGIGEFGFTNYGITAAEKRIATIAAISEGAIDSGSLAFRVFNAGIPTNAIRIAHTGNVGIGTSSSLYRLDVRTPGSTVSQVHIASTDTDAGAYLSSNADNTLYLGAGTAMDGSSNWIAKNAVASSLQFGGVGNIIFYSTSGLTVGGTYTPIERMRITAAGSVGIGSPPGLPSSRFEVHGGRTYLVANNEQYALGLQWGEGLGRYYLGASNSANPDLIFSQTGGVERMRLTDAGNLGIGTGTPGALLTLVADSAAKPGTNTWQIISDIRTKRNVTRFEGDIEIIRKLDPTVSEYNGKAQTPKGLRVVSFDPDELKELVPQCVSYVKGKLDPDDEEETDLAGINTHEIFFHMLRAMQQMDKRIQQLEKN